MVCLDISPTIGLHTEVFNPITRNKKKLLMHPIVNTYIMIKYSSYAIIFIFILFLKLIFAILLSSVAVTDMTRQKSCTTNATALSPMSEQNSVNATEFSTESKPEDYKFWFSYIAAIGTTFKHHTHTHLHTYSIFYF